MDSNIILSYGSKSVSTVISNNFIDHFMADAGDGYVKVYVYLLRCHQDPTRNVTIASIAEALDETEKKIRSALTYWDEKGVISISRSSNGQFTGITVRDLDDYCPDEVLNDDAVCIAQPAAAEAALTSAAQKQEQTASLARDSAIRPTYSSTTLNTFKDSYPDFGSLILYLESLYKRPLTLSELQPVCFLFEQLEFSSDLIGYLYDYCINVQGKTSRNYIEQVAMNWHEAGISTVEDAKRETDSFSSAAQTVKNALGLTDRLKPAEISAITRWSREYGMSDDLIRAACDRSVMQTKNPSLNYVNKIITAWHDNNVKSLDDVKSLDEAHEKTQRKAAQQPKGAYFQYPQRTYTAQEISDIERRKLKQSKLLP